MMYMQKYILVIFFLVIATIADAQVTLVHDTNNVIAKRFQKSAPLQKQVLLGTPVIKKVLTDDQGNPISAIEVQGDAVERKKKLAKSLIKNKPLIEK